MATLTELKKMIAPLVTQSEKVGKSKRFEIDTEKVAKALLNEPTQTIAKADDADANADDLIKGMIGRVTSIHQLLEKAEEVEDGRMFVTTDADNLIAKEFEVAPARPATQTKVKSDDATDTDGEETDTEKRDDDEVDDDEVDWSDLSSAPTRTRKRLSGEEVISTDPSQRKRVATQKRSRQDRQDKRDRARERRRDRNAS